jgi:hypothetical protein
MVAGYKSQVGGSPALDQTAQAQVNLQLVTCNLQLKALNTDY